MHKPSRVVEQRLLTVSLGLVPTASLLLGINDGGRLLYELFPISDPLPVITLGLSLIVIFFVQTLWGPLYRWFELVYAAAMATCANFVLGSFFTITALLSQPFPEWWYLAYVCLAFAILIASSLPSVVPTSKERNRGYF